MQTKQTKTTNGRLETQAKQSQRQGGQGRGPVQGSRLDPSKEEQITDPQQQVPRVRGCKRNHTRKTSSSFINISTPARLSCVTTNLWFPWGWDLGRGFLPRTRGV